MAAACVNSDHSSAVAAATAHVEGVALQADDELQLVVSAWLDSLTPSEALETCSTSLTVPWILVHCCAHRLLRLSSKILEKLVFPIWPFAAKGAVSSGISASDLRSLDNSLVLCQQLLLTEAPSRILPPNNLRQALVLQTERGEALNGKNVVNLIQHLPFLVVLDQSKAVSSGTKRQISLLLEHLSMTPQFKAAAFRNLEVLKDAFLSIEWSQSPLENLEAGMVDVLKMIMSQGSQSELILSHYERMTHTRSDEQTNLPSFDVGSRSSAWRWTSIVLSMRVEFKRLAMQIQSDSDTSGARDTLKRLVQSSLDREMTADDADLLCEAVRGIERVIAQEASLSSLEVADIRRSSRPGSSVSGAFWRE